MPKTFTVRISNHALRSGRWCGTFATIEEAVAYAKSEAARCRSFVEFCVHTGTSKDPGGDVPGVPSIKGEC